eukprot:358445-Chlamydomonas_euryale.AAC.14
MHEYGSHVKKYAEDGILNLPLTRRWPPGAAHEKAPQFVHQYFRCQAACECPNADAHHYRKC